MCLLAQVRFSSGSLILCSTVHRPRTCFRHYSLQDTLNTVFVATVLKLVYVLSGIKQQVFWYHTRITHFVRVRLRTRFFCRNNAAAMTHWHELQQTILPFAEHNSTHNTRYQSYRVLAGHTPCSRCWQKIKSQRIFLYFQLEITMNFTFCVSIRSCQFLNCFIDS